MSALTLAPPRGRDIQWRRALRAVQVLRRDPERIDQTFEVMVALDGGDMERWFQRFLAEPGAERLLAERPQLLEVLSDTDRLLALPHGSLGRAYAELLLQSDKSADGLQQAKRMAPAVEEVCPGPERQWFLERNGCLHDILHTLTGYGQDWAGETALLAFDHGMFPMRARRFGILGVVLTAPLLPDLFVHRYVYRAYRRGKAARIPLAYRWEEALDRPLWQVRRELGIEPLAVAHPEGILTGGQKFGPWRLVSHVDALPSSYRSEEFP